MADEQRPLNAYEKAKDNWKKNQKYMSTLQQVSQGANLDNLHEIAGDAVADSVQDLVEIGDLENAALLGDDYSNTLKLDPFNDKDTLIKRVKGGYKRTYRRHKRDFKEFSNIEDIVSSTPSEVFEGIESLIYKVKPKKDVSEAYSDIIDFHKGLYEMCNYETKDKDGKVVSTASLDKYGKEGTTPAENAKIEAGAREYLIKYYQKLYGSNEQAKKDNKDLIHALIEWIAKDPKKALPRVAQMRAKKIDMFRARLAGLSYETYLKLSEDKESAKSVNESIYRRIPEYMLNAIDEKGIKMLYENTMGIEDKKEKSEEDED